jgi:glycosyltransferase involved in cell wall biosynthesis
MSRMNRHILMVLDHPYPPDVRVENEARSLVEAGFEVSLLALAPDDRPARDEHEGTTLYRAIVPAKVRNVMRGFVSTLPLMDVYLARQIRRVYEQHPFDALHVHDLYLVGAGLRAGRRLGVPVVADLHENWVEALKHYAWSNRYPGKLVVNIPRWERTERRWVRAADRLVVVIEEAAARYAAMGVPRDRITVVPNTVHLGAFRGFEIEKALVDRLRSPLTLVYTGGIDAHRGLETVVDAMPAILRDEPEARLVIVGDGRTKPELEDRAAALGLGERVSFEGWQPQARLKSYIAAADVCLVPHLKTVHTDATIPHKLFHYMFMRKPVVVTDCRPLERIVEGTAAGLVYPSGDAEALTEAVLQLHRNSQARAEMGEQGHRAVVEQYHWDATVQGLVAMYDDLLPAR